MKSVLHKSFKPAKCKTSLKLAVSRIKLMRNKKEVVLRQLKREVAQLLESGQDQSARIRVEHVIREEKMMAAYDLVEIYCELIVARLPIIESQKNCPIDLKEAVSSIIFASPRCADIPELMDVRKQILSKYGREFVTAAVELRPECGVSRMLVEKLSAIAPDGPLKVKVLTDIANEHNIKWEPDWFKDKDSDRPEDLLNVPGTGRDSRIHVESPSPNVEWRDRIPSIIHKPPVIPQNSAPADIGTSQMPLVMPQNSAPEYIGASQMPSTGNFYPEARPEGAQQNFYKDATAAAQAAAESAERASMAARAAVELSSRGQNTSHSSMEMASSSNYGRDQGKKVHVSATQGEHHTQNPRNNSFQGRSPRMPDQQINANEREGQRGGLGDMSFEEDYSQLREEYKVDRPEVMESNNNSYLSTKSIRRQTRSSLSSRSTSGDQYENNMPESPLFDEPADMISGLGSSRLQSDVSGEQCGISSTNNRQRYGNNSSEDIASGFYQGNTWKEEWGVGERSHHSHSYSSAFYDEKDGVTSISDSHKYDVEDKGPFVDLDRGSTRSHHSPSYSRSFYDDKDDVTSGLDLQKYDVENKKGPFFDSDRGNTHSPSYSRAFYDEKDDVTSRMDSQKYDVENKEGPFVDMDHQRTHSKAGAVFDESDSDDDDCMVNTVKDNAQNSGVQSAGEKLGMHSTFSSKSMYQHELSESFKQSSLYSQLVEPVPLSFDDSDGQDSESEEELRKSEVGRKTDTVVPWTDSWEPEILPKTSPESIQSSYRGNRRSNFSSESFDNSPYLKESNEISSPKLIFPELSNSQASSLGYTKSKSKSNSSDLDRWSSSSRADMEKDKQSRMDSFHEEESNLESGMELNYRPLTGGLRHKGYRLPPYTKSTASYQVPAVKESEDSDEKFARGIHEPESNIVRGDLRKGSSSRTPETLIDDSSEDDVPKESPIRKGRPGSSLSRRTKASFPRAYAGSTSSPSMPSEASSPTDYIPETEQSSPYRYASEAISKDRTTITGSGFSGEQDTRSKFLPRTSLEEGSSGAVRGKTSPPRANSVAARSSPEFSKNTDMDLKAPSRENSVKKSSHVHPKLPDYDSLAAHLQSLRVNRK